MGMALMNMAVQAPIPHSTVVRAKGVAEKEILAICKDKSISRIVVGLPLNEDGTESPQCEKVRNFVRRLQKRINVTVEYVDEFLSSEEAHQRLRESSHKRVDTVNIDALAAAIVLERYLAKMSRDA